MILWRLILRRLGCISYVGFDDGAKDVNILFNDGK